MRDVYIIFDIGKTNKKCLVFNEQYNIEYISQCQFTTINDDDGDESEDLESVVAWINQNITDLTNNENFNVQGINVSAYGATIVYLDANGPLDFPVESYTKTYPKAILEQFITAHSSNVDIQTSSPFSGMLNTGLQLYKLKYSQPSRFKKVSWVLHLAQFLSYTLTGQKVSEICNLGCHTLLWDFNKNRYHDWVTQEKFDLLMPPLMSNRETFPLAKTSNIIKVGIGIHDSSAALIPFQLIDEGPFLLISTGTWCVILNPFNYTPISRELLDMDCLQYMSYEGKPVLATKVFLGHEHQCHEKLLLTYYGLKNAEENCIFDSRIYDHIALFSGRYFNFESVDGGNISQNLEAFPNFITAYHRLIFEITSILVTRILLVKGDLEIKNLYLDGGFAKNTVFIQTLQRQIPQQRIIIPDCNVGSALGAMLLIVPNISKSDLTNALNLQTVECLYPNET
ncbi:MAG: FGGY family carbohydrate kinase [Saprospiraceae bacterium]